MSQRHTVDPRKKKKQWNEGWQYEKTIGKIWGRQESTDNLRQERRVGGKVKKVQSGKLR